MLTEPPGYGQPDAGTAAGDNRRLAFERKRNGVGWIQGRWPGAGS